MHRSVVWFLSSGKNPTKILRRPIRFLRKLFQQKHCQLGLRVYNEKRLRENHQNSIGRKQSQKTTELQTYAFFYEKKNDSEGRTMSSEIGAKSHRELLPSFDNESRNSRHVLGWISEL